MSKPEKGLVDKLIGENGIITTIFAIAAVIFIVVMIGSFIIEGSGDCQGFECDGAGEYQSRGLR